VCGRQCLSACLTAAHTACEKRSDPCESRMAFCGQCFVRCDQCGPRRRSYIEWQPGYPGPCDKRRRPTPRSGATHVKKRTTGMTGDRRPRETTLLALVQSLTREGCTEYEVEKRVHELLEGGRFILIGNFRGISLRPSHPGRLRSYRNKNRLR